MLHVVEKLCEKDKKLLPLFFSTQTGPALAAHLHAFSVVTIKSVGLPVPDKSTNFPINAHVNCSLELDSYSFIAFMPAPEIGFNSSSTLKSTAAANEAKHIRGNIIAIILRYLMISPFNACSVLQS